MSVSLDKAKEHFDATGYGEVDVPEWGLKLKFRKAMTIRERTRIFTDADGKQVSGFPSLARCLMVAARDEEGEPAFTEMDLHALTYQVDSAVVSRVASTILAATGLGRTQDEREQDAKNA